jgi:hypothetical protein
LIPPFGDVRLNQFAVGATLVVQVTGQAQLPVPVNMTVCAAGFDVDPCTALKESALEDGGDMVHRG